MSKYIIKNCECKVKGKTTLCVRDIPYKKCENITDCKLKQIVEKCKEDLKPAREWQEGDTVFIEYKKDIHLANNILQLLDIQEVE